MLQFKNIGTNKQSTALIITSIIVLILAMLISLSLGRYPISIHDILCYVFGQPTSDANVGIVLLSVRIPRIVGALFVGGALAVSGAAYQGMFRNPMVSPDILGVSAGASFGASLAILLSLPMFGIQGMAFCFGLLAVMLSFGMSRGIGQNHDKTLMLVLAGMVVGTLFMSMVSLLKYIADSDTKLPAITFWLMGSLASITAADLRFVVPLVLAGMIPLLLVGWRLNVLSFGEDEARAMGLRTDRLRLMIILCASLVTASVISVVGHIGWIGLIIPHIARLLIGPNNKVLLPFSFLLGAIFLLVVDDVARCVSTLEIPLGIITSLIGAPFFLFFLRKSSKKTW